MQQNKLTEASARYFVALMVLVAVLGLATDLGRDAMPMPDYGDGIIQVPFFGRVRLAEYSLPSLAVMLGLADGFNPCAMWALAYLISLMAGQKDRGRMRLLVGAFVASSGILYFLFMTAWLKIFLAIGYIHLLTMLIGMVAVAVGAWNLREVVTTRGALSCPVGGGELKDKATSRMKTLVLSPLSVASFFAIVALAFTVNSIEFACSAALPATYTHVLSLHRLSSLQYYGYILLYDFCFMLDDLIIFSLAALALDTTIGSRYAKYCKAISGVVLLLLGLALIFRPDLLR